MIKIKTTDKTMATSNLTKLTSEQKNILCQAANYLGFTMPIVGKGLATITINPGDVEMILLHGKELEIYTLVTSRGSNSYDSKVFKAAVMLFSVERSQRDRVLQTA